MRQGRERRAGGLPTLQAAVFDLDGVITFTARLHRLAWRRVFETFLASQPGLPEEARLPFTDVDYLSHVDGRPRSDGVRAFLASRGVVVVEGSPDDPPDAPTVFGLGRAKNERFHELLEREGIDVDAAAVTLVSELRRTGLPVGIATSSRNGTAILRRAGLLESFDAIVDGVTSAELHLRGKPAPDIFVECARRLGASSAEHVLVVEDAATGVSAARAGGFGLVIGVDRGGNSARLREAGADHIVRDVGELSAAHIEALWRRRHGQEGAA